MSYNGSGVYTLPGAQLVNGEIVSATENNQFRNDVATALNTTWTRDGQAPATANIPMANHKFTGLAAGTNNGDSVRFEQVSSAVAITGGTIDGTPIGATTPSTGVFADLTVNSNLTVPVGTTAGRNAAPSNGMVRYNTTTSKYEGNFTVAGAAITSITSVSTTATLTTTTTHGLSNGDYITVSGATPAAYNGSFAITVVDGTQFTYTTLTSPGSSASPVGSYISHSWAQFTNQDSTTGAAILPAGTTAQRPINAVSGLFRFNSSITRFEGYNGTTWGSVGGATGGGTDAVFYENGQTVTTDYTITSGKNAMSTGPITIDTGITVTIPTGSNWAIIGA